MDQKIEEMTLEDLADIEAKRSWVRDHFTPDVRHKYENSQDKLRLLDTILKEQWIAPNETLKLQCLGITFGDVLKQEIGLEWVAVEDEHGRTPSLKVEGTSVIVFPMTMISKRIERGEEVDVYSLLENTRELINKTLKEQA